jgi:hypothetical protein
MFKPKNKSLLYFLKNVYIVFSIVLVWRGVWYVLDEVDKYFFGGSHLITAIIGVIIGLVLMYLPDKDLKEIEKL